MARSRASPRSPALPTVPDAWAAHAYAQFGDIKYPAGFSHFEWANPVLPRRHRAGSAFAHHQLRQVQPIHAQVPAPPGLSSLLFETLLTGTMDEPTTGYGLLAEDITVALGQVVGDLPPEPGRALHDGSPVMAADVKHSFDTLMSKQAAPQYRVVFGDVKQAVVRPTQRPFRFQDRERRIACLVGAGCPSSVARGGPASCSIRWSWTFRSRAAHTASAAQLRPRYHLRSRSQLLGPGFERPARFA